MSNLFLPANFCVNTLSSCIYPFIYLSLLISQYLSLSYHAHSFFHLVCSSSTPSHSPVLYHRPLFHSPLSFPFIFPSLAALPLSSHFGISLFLNSITSSSLLLLSLLSPSHCVHRFFMHAAFDSSSSFITCLLCHHFSFCLSCFLVYLFRIFYFFASLFRV